MGYCRLLPGQLGAPFPMLVSKELSSDCGRPHRLDKIRVPLSVHLIARAKSFFPSSAAGTHQEHSLLSKKLQRLT